MCSCFHAAALTHALWLAAFAEEEIKTSAVLLDLFKAEKSSRTEILAGTEIPGDRGRGELYRLPNAALHQTGQRCEPL